MRRTAAMLALGLASCAANPSAGSQHYVVFFDDYSAGLDAAAGATIGAATGWAAAHPDQHVIVSAYAGPADSPPRDALSRARAEAVMGQLARLGVTPARIRLAAHGPIDATTAPTESRRVEIDIVGS